MVFLLKKYTILTNSKLIEKEWKINLWLVFAPKHFWEIRRPTALPPDSATPPRLSTHITCQMDHKLFVCREYFKAILNLPIAEPEMLDHLNHSSFSSSNYSNYTSVAFVTNSVPGDLGSLVERVLKTNSQS